MTTINRLRTILAYELTGQRSYASCDIPTRASIDRLVDKIMRVFG